MTVEVQFTDVDQDESKVVRGQPGESLLDIALANDIELDHACGGVCACSTCHIKIHAGAELLTEASEDEEDQLDDARDVSLESRLGCQAHILPDANGKIIVSIPAWNVNAVQEGHG